MRIDLCVEKRYLCLHLFFLHFTPLCKDRYRQREDIHDDEQVQIMRRTENIEPARRRMRQPCCYYHKVHYNQQQYRSQHICQERSVSPPEIQLREGNVIIAVKHYYQVYTIDGAVRHKQVAEHRCAEVVP